jgi:hypothetical protein
MREKGEVYVSFTPKTNRFDLEKIFFADTKGLASITTQLKNRMDQELKRRGINVRSSRMEPDFQTFGLKYYAEYDPPKRYGVAIGPAIQAAIKVAIKAIIQAVKAIIKLVIKVIQGIVKFIQKLMVYIKNIIQIFDQALQKLRSFIFTGQGDLDPNNPENELNSIESKADKELGGATKELGGATSSSSPSNISFSPNSWVIFGGIGALALVLVLLITVRK